MKKTIFVVLLVLFFSASCIFYVPSDYNSGPRQYPREDTYDYGRSDVSYFYDYLSPYGLWVRYEPHGYVWVPRRMGYRWRPYTMGHWAWTDYGWMWLADEEWGWACFHYGRWGFDDDIGWFWVPGAVWAPSWVVWRSGPDYFGWAPIPPGIEFSLRYGFRSDAFDIPGHYWIFVESRYFLGRRLDRYILPFERNPSLFRRTEFHRNVVVRDNRVFNEGIDVDTVRRVTRQQISRLTVGEGRKPAVDREELGRVTTYKPDLRDSGRGAPKRYVNKDEARKDLEQSKIWDPKPSRDDDPSVIRKRFDQEAESMERSQGEESRRVREKYAEKESGARDTVEKSKIQKERDAELGDLKKRHDEERQALSERQKKDEEQVKKKIKKVEK